MNLLTLPDDALSHIFTFHDNLKELLRLRRVCKRFRSVASRSPVELSRTSQSELPLVRSLFQRVVRLQLIHPADAPLSKLSMLTRLDRLEVYTICFLIIFLYVLSILIASISLTYCL